MKLRDFLSDLGILVDSDEDAVSFLTEDDVKGFLLEKWHQKSLLPETNDVLSDEEMTPDAVSEPDITDNNNVTDMGIYTNANQSDFDKEKNDVEVFETHVNNAYIIFKNGKVNQPYSFVFDKHILDGLNIGTYWFEGLGALGLHYDVNEGTITGIPTVAGDHKILLFYRHKDWDENRPALVRNINLVITPDPRSLWNEIPTPHDIAYYKPDSDKLFLEVAAKSKFLGFTKERQKDIVAASQRGRSHAHDGNARDDDFRVSYSDVTGWYVMAVADGAGSAQFSRKGSQIACETTVEICNMYLEESEKSLPALISDYNGQRTDENKKAVNDAFYTIIGTAVFRAYNNIKDEAQRAECAIKDFSTTLILTLCRKFKSGWFVVSFRVGDGGIGIYDKEKRFLKIMGDSDGGEFAGQTRFITMPEIIQAEEIYSRINFEFVEDFTSIVLMTDGITDPIFETDANLLKIDKWDGLWNSLSETVTFDEKNQQIDSQLLEWLNFWSPGNHDDRTIVVLF
jgi:serine/threonine protein phosphatase PrpC